MARQAEVHFYHHDTPKKARVKGAVAFAQQQKERYGRDFSYNEIFRACQVSKTRGYEIIKSFDRKFHNACKETRGRKKLLTDEDLDKIERLLWSEGFEARRLTYPQLLPAAGIDKEVHSQTIQRALGTRQWRKCIACPRSFVSQRHAKQRVEFARKSLEERPTKEDYRDIAYSDEWHVACGDDRQVNILRKPGERYCPDCLYERPDPRKLDEEKFNAHFWGAVGYNFKSDLHEYRISTNNNGKMSANYYRDHILKKIVMQWPDQGINRILEEDCDSAHRSVHDWKINQGIKFYYNAAGSPDLSPIENVWRIPAMAIESLPYNNRQDLIADVKEAWDNIDQQTINNFIDSMPARFKAVLELEGKMTGF